MQVSWPMGYLYHAYDIVVTGRGEWMNVVMEYQQSEATNPTMIFVLSTPTFGIVGAEPPRCYM